jgi:hypothetical protein
MEICITGDCRYYAGGGGGGPENDISVESGYGKGGLGGGGFGALGSVPPQDGKDGTGGGGGGMGYAGSNSHTGGAGGNGIVVIRYETDFCDRRGPKNQCIMDSERGFQPNTYTIDEFFRSDMDAELSSESGVAVFDVSNSSSLSGTWKGSFEIAAAAVSIKPGADFRPDEGEIVLDTQTSN